MFLERIEAKGLAHFSYVLASQGSAVIIDPRRDIDVYTDLLAARGWKAVAILETHIHADYASGTRELAAATGAPMYLSAHDEGETFHYAFPHRELRDGEEVHVGDLRIVAYHTPGHTPEHLSFLVFEKSRCGQPVALFSGDFVFVGSLGRPDLLGEDAKRSLAHKLYQSVHTRIASLPDFLLIYPGHGAGSLCGANLSDRSLTTLGYERFCNIFMTDQPEDIFVEQILSTVPEFPDYYRRMKALNSAGAPILGKIPGEAELDLPEFERLVASGATVIDLRNPVAFGAGHITGAMNIGAGGGFGLYAPWVVPPDKPVLFIGEGANSAEEARRALIRVGVDDLRGSLKGGYNAWAEAHLPIATIPQIKFSELGSRTLLDVRSPAEFALNHAPGAISMPVGKLAVTLPTLHAPLAVICGSGYRSSLVASLLKRAGIADVANVTGGMAST